MYTSINKLISHLLGGLYPRGVARSTVSTVSIEHPVLYDLILK